MANEVKIQFSGDPRQAVAAANAVATAGVAAGQKTATAGVAASGKLTSAYNRIKSAGAAAFNKVKTSAQKAIPWIEKNQTSIQSLGRKITAIGVAGGLLFGSMVYQSTEFSQKMANVQSVAGATAGELNQLTAAAEHMGKTTAFSASQAAEAQYNLVSAGQSAGEAIKSLGGVMLLAGATGAGLAESSDLVTSSLNQFQLAAGESSRVANTYAAVIAATPANMYKLASSMRYAGSIAKALDYSIETTTATMGLLYQAGFKGEQAGTMWRAGMMAMIKPSAEAAKVIKNMGLQIKTASGQMLPMAQILDQLKEKQMTVAQAAGLFGTEAAGAFLALASKGGSALRSLEDRITGTKKAAEMYQIQMDTTKGSIIKMKSAIEALSISLGKTLEPMVKSAADTVAWLATAVNDMPPALKTTIVAVGGITTALALVGGPMLLIISYVPQMVAGFGMISAAMATSTIVAKGATVAFVGLRIAAVALVAIPIAHYLASWITGLGAARAESERLKSAQKGVTKEAIAWIKKQGAAEKELEKITQKNKQKELAVIEVKKAAAKTMIAGLEKWSQKIQAVGKIQIGFAKENYTASLKEAQGIEQMSASLESYAGVINQVYAVQKEQYSAIAGMLVKQGAAKEANLQQTLNILEAEKAAILAKLSAHQSYYSQLQGMHTTAVQAQESAIKKLLALETKYKAQQETVAGTVLTLKRKLMTVEERSASKLEEHENKKAALEIQGAAALKLTGEAKVKALMRYITATEKTAHAVVIGGETIISKEEAVTTALENVQLAQEALVAAEAGVVAAQKEKIAAQKIWIDDLKDAMAVAKAEVAGFRDELGYLQKKINSMEMKMTLGLDTTAANNQLSAFVNKWSNTHIPIVFEMLVKKSPVGAFGPQMAAVEKTFLRLPKQQTYTINAGPAMENLFQVAQQIESLRSQAASFSTMGKTITLSALGFGRGTWVQYPQARAQQQAAQQSIRTYQNLYNHMASQGAGSAGPAPAPITHNNITVERVEIIVQGENKSVRELAREIRIEFQHMEALQGTS